MASVSTDRQIKENVLYTHNGIVFGLTKEILQYVTIWMNHEGIMLSQLLHDFTYMSHLK